MYIPAAKTHNFDFLKIHENLGSLNKTINRRDKSTESNQEPPRSRQVYSFPKFLDLAGKTNPLATVNSIKVSFQNLVASLELRTFQQVERFITPQIEKTPINDYLTEQYLGLKKFFNRAFEKVQVKEFFPAYLTSSGDSELNQKIDPHYITDMARNIDEEVKLKQRKLEHEKNKDIGEKIEEGLNPVELQGLINSAKSQQNEVEFLLEEIDTDVEASKIRLYQKNNLNKD
ncbi:MAG: hypothetical protein QNJ31_03440 [Candidatus Caenarcaniphilales bacterium]|nr:hypothetical protein [Candidatus Caenarcaniphilales bacterium]